MPIHDWQRVTAGIYHDFHNAWIAELRMALNTGILPSEYYALMEQVAGKTGPDVLTLQHRRDDGPAANPASGVATVTAQPPQARIVQRMEERAYVRKRKTLVIRHSSDDRIIAIIEIMSPGNKASVAEFRRFLDKAVSALNQDIHLLIVDLFPPGKRDPQGIHGAILSELCGLDYEAPADKPLTVASYKADDVDTAYVEPVAVGDVLPPSPLFLDGDEYVRTPLEATYEAAYRGVPQRWRSVLEA